MPPVVVVAGKSPAVDHRIDRARAAEHLAARPVARPAAGPRVRRRRVAPVHLRIVERHAVADRHFDRETSVAPARLDEQGARASAGAEPLRQHTSSRAGAYDDEVASLVRHASPRTGASGHPLLAPTFMVTPGTVT